MKTIKKIILISFLILESFFSISQNYITVKGVVIDENTNQRISYVSISILNKPVGVISNENGEFVFKIPNTFITEDLCISILGYESYIKKVSDFSENTYYTIKLKTKKYNIEEITVEGKKKHLSPTKIVQQSLENIESNYPTKPLIYQGYYREYLKQGNKNYLNLLEAAIMIKDKGFKSNFSHITLIYYK